MHHNCNNYIKSFSEGNSSEDQFNALAQNKGFSTRKSTRSEDIYKHIDLFLIKNGKTISFDVKSAKRSNRHTGKQNDCAVWVEFKNVSGNAGWIYGGQDYIAFDFIDHFVIVKTIELRDFLTEIFCKEGRMVERVSDAYFNLYQRKNRKDLITRIDRESLLILNHRIWYKH